MTWNCPSSKRPSNNDANTLYLLRAVPGIGELLSLVLLYEIHNIQRFPRVQDFVSYCRLVKWAFAEAAVLFLRANPAGQKDLVRLEKKHSTRNTLTVVAHKLARGVYDTLTRHTAFDTPTFLRGSGEKRASLALTGEPATFSHFVE